MTMPYVNSIINCSILFHIFIFYFFGVLSFISFSSRNMKLKLNFLYKCGFVWVVYVVCWPRSIFFAWFSLNFHFATTFGWLMFLTCCMARLLDSIQFFTFCIVFHLVVFCSFILHFSVQVPSVDEIFVCLFVSVPFSSATKQSQLYTYDMLKHVAQHYLYGSNERRTSFIVWKSLKVHQKISSLVCLWQSGLSWNVRTLV